MAADFITLTYWRDGAQSTFSGSINSAAREIEFSKYTFEQVITEVRTDLVACPTHRLVMRRREAAYPVTLPTSLEDLIRTDPQSAIAKLTVPPQRVEVRSKKTEQAVVSKVLRVGHDTLADALGDVVYVKARKMRKSFLAESLLNGRWCGVFYERLDGNHYLDGLVADVNVFDETHRWLTVKTEDVLSLAAHRVYLPRAWNPLRTTMGGWITLSDLASMYEAYKQEKSSVSVK